MALLRPFTRQHAALILALFALGTHSSNAAAQAKTDIIFGGVSFDKTKTTAVIPVILSIYASCQKFNTFSITVKEDKLFGAKSVPCFVPPYTGPAPGKSVTVFVEATPVVNGQAYLIDGS